MQFDFTLHYRDELEASRAAFPSDPATSSCGRAARPPLLVVLGWACVVCAGFVLFRTLSTSPAFCPAAVAGEADYAEGTIDPESGPPGNPVFVGGAVAAGVGSALFLMPLAYVLGRRNAARPLHDKPASVRIDDDGLTLRTDAKEFRLAWDGVVAVAETKNLFVLKTLGDLRVTLPKRALLDCFGDDRGRIDDLRQALQNYITPAAAAVAA